MDAGGHRRSLRRKKTKAAVISGGGGGGGSDNSQHDVVLLLCKLKRHLLPWPAEFAISRGIGCALFSCVLVLSN